jgi:hypothetical protein
MEDPAAFSEQHGETSGNPVEVVRLIADVAADSTPAVSVSRRHRGLPDGRRMDTGSCDPAVI